MKAKVYSKKQLEDMDTAHKAEVTNPLPSWARPKLGDPKPAPIAYARGGMVKKGKC